MSKISEALTYGLTIRESATDGSDFSNPSTDYRRLFLGEDGVLHLKDSAGAVTDIGSSSGIPATLFDAKGDIIAATAADTAARVAVGADGTFVMADSGSTPGLKWYVPVCTVVSRANVGGNITTSSTTFVDMDSTNLTVTLTTRAVRVRLTLVGVHTNDGSGNVNSFNFSVDGTVVTPTGTSDRGLGSYRASAAGASNPMLTTYLTDVLTAASHTFRPMWKVSAGTATGLQTASTDKIQFTVEETMYTA